MQGQTIRWKKLCSQIKNASPATATNQAEEKKHRASEGINTKQGALA